MCCLPDRNDRLQPKERETETEAGDKAKTNRKTKMSNKKNKGEKNKQFAQRSPNLISSPEPLTQCNILLKENYKFLIE